jgi:hypothetical protein
MEPIMISMFPALAVVWYKIAGGYRIQLAMKILASAYFRIKQVGIHVKRAYMSQLATPKYVAICKYHKSIHQVLVTKSIRKL